MKEEGYKGVTDRALPIIGGGYRELGNFDFSGGFIAGGLLGGLL